MVTISQIQRGFAAFVDNEVAAVFNGWQKAILAGAAGLLGVEGVPDDVIIKAVTDALQGMEAGVTAAALPVTAAELFEAGLTGRADSAEKRAAFLKAQGLPADLSVKQMLRYLNAVPGPEALRELLKNI